MLFFASCHPPLHLSLNMAFQPPPNLDEILALVAQTEATGTTLAELVIQIDIHLAKIDEALGKLQPWKSGKLRIKWWKKRGRLVPSVVKWICIRPGLWRAERVSLESLVLVVKTSHEWRADSPVVKDLMRMTKRLLELRTRALDSIHHFKAVAALSITNQPLLESMNADLDDLLVALENRTEDPDSEPGPSSAVLLEMAPEDD